GETGKAMRTVDQRLPEFLDKFQKLLDTFQETNSSIERWVGFETRPHTRKQLALAVAERFAVLAVRVWLVL
ncbi:MAG TPA: hypothetical protein VFO27_04820, partial [Bryobacteraceae bacterium]|nr:hypothetical protein [Bryobacteraceae bacterium]